MNEDIRTNFNTTLAGLNLKKNWTSSDLTREKLSRIICRVNELQNGAVKKEPKDYRFVKHYDIARTTSIHGTVVYQLTRAGENIASIHF